MSFAFRFTPHDMFGKAQIEAILSDSVKNTDRKHEK